MLRQAEALIASCTIGAVKFGIPGNRANAHAIAGLLRRLRAAGPTGYVLVRDATCRLFGYHGLMDEAGGFSLDHMFGF